MSASHWQQVEELFARALELPLEERAAYVAAAASDRTISSEVQSLLQAHEGRGPLDSIADQLQGLRPAAAAVSLTDLLARLQKALGDRYRFERELGRGGMAIVLLAEDLKHRRKVALKVLQPDLALSIGHARFLQEISIAARLAHPHILPLHDSGEADGLLYYVMPYVEGESLRVRLKREGRLPLGDALQITRQVADALAYAHRHDVVHRDIKPENILLEAGHAVVSDFGIARAMSTSGAPGLTESGMVLGTPAYLNPEQATPRDAGIDEGSEALTASGVTVGTPAYMSPEQGAGASRLDGRTDVYSLGCVLYEMLAGGPPFGGLTPQDISARRLLDPVPPLRTVRDAVPAWLEAAVVKALAKVPTDRFDSAAQFSQALAAPVGAQAIRRISLLRTVLTVGVLAVGVALFSRRTAHRSPDPNAIAVAPFDVLDRKFELWHEGLVDYLSRNLDGAGPLRTVSPTIVLRRWTGRADATSARELGRRTGAGLVVFGQIMGAGSDSARLRVTILDVTSGKVLAAPERRDLADRIDRLADSLTRDLLRDLGRIGSEGHIRLASTATKSLPALKAFLRGEQFLRRFSLDSAIQAYEEAVKEDSSFALALRRSGLARGWRGQSGGPLGLKAGSFNHGLAPRDSLLIVADSLEAASDDMLDSTYWSRRVRKFSVLEEASRRYPDDPEVWYAVGEARFHLGYAVGSTAEQTIDAFDKAIALDSAFAPAYFHPVQLALDRNDTAAARRYINGYLGLTSGVPEGSGLRVVDRLLHPIRAKAPELQSVLNGASANVLFDAWRSVQRWPDSSEAGVLLLRLLATGRQGIGISADTVWARYLLATELLYRGHLREASDIVGSRFSQPFAELAAMGFLSADSASTAFDRWLRSPNERVVVADPPWVGRCYRSFLAAEWWARRQDTVALFTLIRHGDSVVRSARSIAERIDARADASLGRAALALARRDTGEALRRFLAFPDSLCAHLYGSLSPSLAPLHMVRFQLLAATGRDREAALVFDQQVTVPLTASSVMATLQRGSIAERLGDRPTALRHYQFVLAVWRNADPELQPYVAKAHAALKRLGGEPR